MIWRKMILFLACWLLAAHFLRDGNTAICIIISLFPLLVFSKQKMALRWLQVVLVFAVFTVWLPSAFSILEYRIATDRSWLRMAVIMASVMMFTLFAAGCVSGLITSKKNN